MSRALDPRLRAASEAVREGAVAADVGTDHGYLICELVGGVRCPRGYASDVAAGPLEAARRHIRERGLEDRITALLSDGLRELPGSEIDDIVIAGMGGELIGRLLTGVEWTRDPDKRFVLQPMTKAAELRLLLCREGFSIVSERAVRSGRFVYSVITAAYTGKKHDPDRLFAETGLLLKNPDAAALEYLDKVRRRIETKAKGLLRTGGREDEAAELFATAKKIDEVLGNDSCR